MMLMLLSLAATPTTQTMSRTSLSCSQAKSYQSDDGGPTQRSGGDAAAANGADKGPCRLPGVPEAEPNNP